MLRAAILIAATLFAMSASAQWRALRWDMTLDEVRALYPGLKQIGRESQGTIAPHLFGDGALIQQFEQGTRIQATLLFDFDRLREIRLLGPGLEEGRALLALLRSHYGEPSFSNTLSNEVCNVQFAHWDDGPHNSRIRFRLSDCATQQGEAVIEPIIPGQ